ncbi:MAG: OmpA/MotB family protein, partial [Bdellovibrionota bacterium]
DRPIHTEQFSSNWALSAGRAVNVLHFISANGIDERRMMVRAFADTRPVATVAENRAQNRRVTILVF